MQVLFILNDPPYGTERSYNGLGLALSLAKRPEVELRIFLMADAAFCAQSGQRTPEGSYSVERMLRGLAAAKGIPIGACGTCMDARGITDEMLLQGAHRSSMSELAEWTLWADRVVSF